MEIPMQGMGPLSYNNATCVGFDYRRHLWTSLLPGYVNNYWVVIIIVIINVLIVMLDV